MVRTDEEVEQKLNENRIREENSYDRDGDFYRMGIQHGIQWALGREQTDLVDIIVPRPYAEVRDELLRGIASIDAWVADPKSVILGYTGLPSCLEGQKKVILGYRASYVEELDTLLEKMKSGD